MSRWKCLETFLVITLIGLAFSVSACASRDAVAPAVITAPCHVPEKLDYVAQGPAPLQSVDTPLASHLQNDAQERKAHRVLAGDYNALRDHLTGC